MPPDLVLAAPCSAELVEKRSRFLALAAPAHDVAEAEAVIRAARTAHPSARHHASAMIIGAGRADATAAPILRSNDDGEPGGTAGMPMQMVLEGAGLDDVVAVVTRYFGGTKLGTGGLARAYGGALSRALEGARLLRRTEMAVVELEVPHAQAGLAENAVRRWAETPDAAGVPRGRVEDVQYRAEGVRLVLLVRPGSVPELEADVATWSSGRRRPHAIGHRLVDLPV